MNAEQELIRLVERNKEKYYRIAFAYVKNKDDALDIIHDTIVKALQKIDSLRKKEYLETWFYRILINESISNIRKSTNIVYFDELPEYQIPAAEDLDKEQYLTLYSAIDKLPPKLKTIVILRFFEDMKLDEIAEITSTKLSTVKARLYKALKLLQMEIKDTDYDY